MTKQEVFNKVWNHFVVNSAPLSYKGGRNTGDERFQCMYRGPNGTRCAVGLLIPDEKYDPKIEDYTLSSILDKGYVPGFGKGDFVFLDLLQIAHDSCCGSNSSIRSKLEDFAARFDLSIPQ